MTCLHLYNIYWYDFKKSLFIPPKWDQLLNALPYKLPTSVIKHSVLNQSIYAHLLKGPKKYSYGHKCSNESTNTRALLDLFDHLHSTSGAIIGEVNLVDHPSIKPDGSTAYTRLNTNNIDLNRDALDHPNPKVLP